MLKQVGNETDACLCIFTHCQSKDSNKQMK